MTRAPTDADAPLDEAVPLRVGELIAGKYAVVRLLGTGGFGAVFQARHVGIGREVAIKVLRASLAQDPQFAERFLQEARTANEVRHRNIVEVVDFGDDGGRLYMVMEYLRGEPLAELLARERVLSPARILRVLEPVMRALGAAHARGIVHRDIKPENIFLARHDDDGEGEHAAAVLDEPVPKLLDFGIAKRSSRDGVRLTHSHATLGTPAYMAPEQLTGARDVTPAADQYAIAAIVYEALAGRMPYTGDNYNAVIIAKATAEPLDLGELRPDLDPALCAAVMRALARRPEDRHGSIGALRDALAPFQTLDAPAPERVLRDAQSHGVSSLAATEVADSDGPRTPVVATPRTATALVPTDAATGVVLGAVGTPPRGRRTRWIAGVAIASLAVAGTWAAVAASAGSGTVASPATRVVPVTQVTLASPAAAAPAGPATLRVRVTPTDATIALDQRVLGRGSAQAALERDGAHHVVRLESQGFVPFEEDLVLDRDRELEVELVPAAAPAAPAVEPRRPGVGAPHRATGDRLRPTIDHHMDLMHGGN